MILFWGLKKFPLRLEIPTLKDHLSAEGRDAVHLQLQSGENQEVLSSLVRRFTVKAAYRF